MLGVSAPVHDINLGDDSYGALAGYVLGTRHLQTIRIGDVLVAGDDRQDHRALVRDVSQRHVLGHLLDVVRLTSIPQGNARDTRDVYQSQVRTSPRLYRQNYRFVHYIFVGTCFLVRELLNCILHLIEICILLVWYFVKNCLGLHLIGRVDQAELQGSSRANTLSPWQKIYSHNALQHA